MWDFLFEILSSFGRGASIHHDSTGSRVGESEFERETARYWAKWAFGLGMAAAAAYGAWWLWHR